MTKEPKADLGSQRFLSWMILMFYLCNMLMPLAAEDNKPDVFVSMYFASETDVCSPDGYSSQVNDTPNPCDQMTFKRLKKMLDDKEVTNVRHKIPPEKLRLGKLLLDSIEAYSDDCPLKAPCLKSSRRYAVILTFEVAGTDCVGCDIKIRRDPPSKSNIPRYTFEGKLSEKNRWINHQRADVFLPSHHVRWDLIIGDWCWRLGTTR